MLVSPRCSSPAHMRRLPAPCARSTLVGSPSSSARLPPCLTNPLLCSPAMPRQAHRRQCQRHCGFTPTHHPQTAKAAAAAVPAATQPTGTAAQCGDACGVLCDTRKAAATAAAALSQQAGRQRRSLRPPFLRTAPNRCRRWNETACCGHFSRFPPPIFAFQSAPPVLCLCLFGAA